jgi:diguanylate cyclase (GGDEF)-like protein
MEIKIYLQMIWRGWWIIVLTALVAMFVALLAAYFATPLYQASTRFIVSPNSDLIDGRDIVDSLATLDRRSIITTYAEFMSSDRVYNETITNLQLNSADLVDYELTTVVLPDANILELTVEGPDALTSALLANAIGQGGVQYIRQVYQVYEISILDPAFVPVYPISPQPFRDAILAFALGTVLGVALAIVSEQLRVPLESLRERTAIDSASSAYNRRYFERLLEGEIIRSRRENGIFSLCLIRLEGLTDFLDTLPTPILNRLLRHTANTLHKELKGTDIIGRWDRDVFGIILPSTPYEAAQNAMRRVRWALTEPVQITEDGEVLELNPMVGVARSQQDESLENLMIRAERELANSRHSPDAQRPAQHIQPLPTPDKDQVIKTPFS